MEENSGILRNLVEVQPQEDSSVDNLRESSKKIIKFLKNETVQLKHSYMDDKKFEELLQIIHGRFSKLELNLLKLERYKDANVQ